ncbi:MAG TPA: ribonuclease D [Vicinamibacteria bacterium]|nr:ribonuclease D [Vicinamibacteria bacterium]
MSPWIRTPEELQAFVLSLRGCRVLALDSESDSLHHHREKVCLIQITSDRDQARLIDPLALRDLSSLAPLLADPDVLKVLHGADYDVTTLKRDFGFRFANLFDTMIAARFLGLPEIGLQAMARTELEVSLSKTNQRDDWSRRPLSPAQEAYALADVHHLLALQARLADKLTTLGRLSWVQEECQAVADLPPARREADPDAYLRVKGASRLRPRNLAVLRELCGWREGRAAASDVPAFKILSSETLLALADNPPHDLEDLRRVRGILPRLQAQASAVLTAVQRALALPETDLPVIRKAPRPAVPEPVRRRIDALRAWRTAEATRLAVDVSVVLPQRLLERVAEAGPREAADLERVEGLRRWRIAAFGPAMVAASGAGEGR